MKRDFTSKKKWEINGISGFDAKKETEGGADIANESYLQTVFRRFRRHHLALISLIVLTVLCGAALLAPIIAPYEPDEIVGTFSGAPSKEFWLGTDQIGRDVFSRLLYAMRISAGGSYGDFNFNGSGRYSGAGCRVFRRRGGYGDYAFYGYGDVLSLYSAGFSGGCYF